MFWIVFDILEIVLDPSMLFESALVAFLLFMLFSSFLGYFEEFGAVHVVSSCFWLIQFLKLV